MGEINTDLREIHMIGPGCRELLVGRARSPSLNLCDIALTGTVHAVPEFRFVRTRARFSQILVCLEGWGKVWVGGEWRHCTPGTAYLTPVDAFHAYHAESHKPWRFCFVMYARSLRTGPLAALREPALVPAESRQLAQAIGGLYDESIGANEPAAMHHWTALVHQYAQRLLEPPSTDQRLGRLWRDVEMNLAYPWDLPRLAARINVTPEHLRRLCQQDANESPMRHVARLRMQRAALLLASNIYTVEIVATQVGYTNPFAFSTAFKREIGVAPSEYRARMQRPPDDATPPAAPATDERS